MSQNFLIISLGYYLFFEKITHVPLGYCSIKGGMIAGFS